MAVKPIPEGYHTVTPYLVSEDAEALLTFLKKAFDAKEVDVVRVENDAIMHGDVLIGDSHVMFAQANERFPPMKAGLYLYVPDVDATYKAALAAGATSTQEPANQFYGDRSAGVTDSLGNMWWLGTHVEDVPPEEMERRMKQAAAERAT